MKSTGITCEAALAVLMGGSDEFTGDTIGQARLHASRCPRCRSAYAAGLSPDALNALSSVNRGPAPTLRFGLFVVGATQLVLALPWLFGRSFLPDAHVAVSHLTRDGAFGLVAASCGLVTVWRPRYVNATMWIGLVVLVLQVVSGIVDEHDGFVTGSFELAHVLVLLVVVGLFAIAVNMAGRATPRAKPNPFSFGVHSTLTGLQRTVRRPDHD